MHRCPSCQRRRASAEPCPLDGWTPPPESLDIDDPAPAVDGIAIGQRLGRGGFAVVWAGVTDGDRRSVAVKVGLTRTAMLEERFRREAEALEQVGPPHTPRFYGSGRLDDGRPYLVMERLFGAPLAAELADLAAPPDPAWAVARMDAVLAALEAAHARGVIHRDLKPENIFVCDATPREGLGDARASTERVALIDFGLTKRASTARGEVELVTRTGAVVGTPEYMAPEQIRGDAQIDERTDLYAIGVILFELMTLRLPFAGDGSAIEHGHLALRPQRPSDLAPVPIALEELTLACLAKDPARRPASAAALRRALAELTHAARVSLFDETHDTHAHAPPSSRAAPSSTRTPPASVRFDAPPDSARMPRATQPPASAKLIAEGRHPVVLLVAETQCAASQVIAAVSGRKGFVTRQRGARYVAVFSGKDAEHPAQAALAAARELVDQHGARAALHLASVTIRRKDRGAPSAYGAPVERPETWIPAGSWTGVALTAEFERALPQDDGGPVSARTEPSLEVDIALSGRDEVLAEINASAEAAFDGTCPGLFTLVGEPGLGKSRLALEASIAALVLRPEALVVPLRATQPLPGEAARETAELLRIVLDAPAETPIDPAAFCRERLGDDLGESTWPAVAAVLGWTLPASTQRAGAPASLHHNLVRALGEGLRRRARRGSHPVAVVLDDAHWADDALVDALEYATLDGDGIALWVVVVAHPRFERVRRTWGARTQRHGRAALKPLDEAPAMALAAQLLLPAEYPPAETLRRLVAWSGGNPACLSEVVRSLKRAGLVRRRANAGTYYVATAELDSLPPSPAWQWLAARQLDALPPELAACVRLCSVLGMSFTRDELEQIQDAIDRAGGAGTPIDASYGLSALAERGIFRRNARSAPTLGERYSFQSAVFQDAVHELLDPAQREQIHRHALEFWRARLEASGPAPEDLEALARHAGACGARDEAADAFLKLGDLAFAKHRHTEADQHYTAALSAAAESDDRRRALALMGRGKSRYRIHRPREATEDLSAARALVERLGDEAFLADVLLEESTALDWANDFEASAQRMAEARAVVERLGTTLFQSRVLVAEGRAYWRRGRMAEAVDLLTQGVAIAELEGDYDTRIVALLVLSWCLCFAGQLDASDARIEEAIALSSAAEDWTHLCSAYVNRIPLRAMRRELHLALEEMRRTVAMVREIGNPFLEYMATANIAELLHVLDHRDEALPLARRAHMLEQRFLERPAPDCSLLLARLLAAGGEYSEASEMLAWIARSCPPEPSTASLWVFCRMLQLVLDELHVEPGAPRQPAATWDQVLAQARGNLPAIDLLEVLHWGAVMALHGGRFSEAVAALDDAKGLLEEAPMWRARFDALASRLATVEATAGSI